MGSLRSLTHNPLAKKNIKEKKTKHHSWQAVLSNRIGTAIYKKYGTAVYHYTFDISYQKYKNNSGVIHVDWFDSSNFDDFKDFVKQVVQKFIDEKGQIYDSLKLDVIDISFIYENQHCLLVI